MKLLAILFIFLCIFIGPVEVETYNADSTSSDEEMPSYSLDLPLEGREDYSYCSLDDIFQNDSWYEEEKPHEPV